MADPRFTHSRDPRVEEAFARRNELIERFGMLPPGSAGSEPLDRSPGNLTYKAWSEKNLRCAHDQREWDLWRAEHRSTR